MPISTGTITPKRSASRPIRMPPKPNPIIVTVYGSDASEREMPNSACIAGRATAAAYIPTPPSVIRPSEAASRAHAYGVSNCCEATAIAEFSHFGRVLARGA